MREGLEEKYFLTHQAVYMAIIFILGVRMFVRPSVRPSVRHKKQKHATMYTWGLVGHFEVTPDLFDFIMMGF